MLEASICMSTYNKPDLLKKTLESIYAQDPPFEFEVIVVDDGSPDSRNKDVCSQFPVIYYRIEREPGFRNPCIARNTAYKMARADVIIAQSDEVIHKSKDCIERLVYDLKPGTILFAHVFSLAKDGSTEGAYIGPERRAPYFFLGSVFREDLYAVGGNDEDFIICPAWEDTWLGECLTKGRGLTPIYSTNFVGHHQWHERHSTPKDELPSRNLYCKKFTDAMKGVGPWTAASGPWPYIPFSKADAVDSTGSGLAERIFTDIYENMSWGKDQESRSGAGSSLAATENIRRELPKLVEKYGIKTILDIPCGDFNWMKHVDLKGVKYIGADIVTPMVESLQKQYGSKDREFVHLDLMSSDLPKADLVICRDCLVHLSYLDFRRAIDNIIRSGAKYLLATTFTNRRDNNPIRTGEWSPYNLRQNPFCFPKELECVNENCREWYPHFNDKSVCLWSVSDLEKKSPIKSIVVCVEYDDFLEITLPRNSRHFSKTLVVTSPADKKTQAVARKYGCECYTTDAFYRDGAAFNKGLAMEEGFDVLGRDGWICVWDADIVMPDNIEFTGKDPSCLYSPVRCLLEDPTKFKDDMDWKSLPIPTRDEEFDGFFQMFHASSVKRPWYGTQWRHAGGCDSDFQLKYPVRKRKRLPFVVLHLGSEGVPELGTRIGRNWRGRVTPRIDTGEVPKDAEKRFQDTKQMIVDRQMYGTAKEVLPEKPGMPKRISFFWHGRMSWLRWLTLKTFRMHNPDWEINVYSSRKGCGERNWKTPEVDDSQYEGEDWCERLDELGVLRKRFHIPVRDAAPAQASDIFQWNILSTEGGFYADMDILWIKPMDEVLDRVTRSDAVFCLETGLLAIGFLAANNKCPVFRDALNAMPSTPNGYQCYGTELLYKAFPSKRGNEPIGIRTVNEIRRRYPSLKIDILPDSVVYPFNWEQVDKIFLQDLPCPEDSYGIHWFGGSAMALKYGKLLTPITWKSHKNTIANAMRAIGL
jgi:hypothetical protein